MTTPIRLQLSRAKGFNLQQASLAANGLPAVNVARPSDAGNPFTESQCREIGYRGTPEAIARICVDAYRGWLGPWRHNLWSGPESEQRREKVLAMLPYLRGKNLACWCKADAPCHADVLLDLANRPTCKEVSDNG